jgi:predicted dehydrogenase
MTTFSRRSFLRASAAAGTALAGATTFLSPRSYARVSGANGDVRVAIVGLAGKGKDHLKRFQALPGVRVVALCDVDSTVLAEAAQAARTAGSEVKTYADYRELLASKDVDAVSIVTPNHQHTLQAIWAMQAGKDVFLEKPVSHDIWEGQQLVRATEKYGRIVQAGTQNRSSTAIGECLAWLREGQLGRVTTVRGFCYKRRISIGKSKGPQPVPAGVDYDRWLGPAPKAPLLRQRFHYDWHWQWATGNGDIGNQGNHQLDVARRFLGEASLPPRVSAVGGRFGYDDDGETPNTLVVLYEYKAAPLIFEVRGLPVQAGSDKMDQYGDLSVGNVIECEGGSIIVPSGDYSSARVFDRKGVLLKDFKGSGDHYANFIEAVQSRKAAHLTGQIRDGHVSSALSHLPNIALLTGQPRSEKDAQAELKHSPILADALKRMTRHLAVNGVDLQKTPLQGSSLTVDPATERFTGEKAGAANAQLRRKDRAPYVVPEIG